MLAPYRQQRRLVSRSSVKSKKTDFVGTRGRIPKLVGEEIGRAAVATGSEAGGPCVGREREFGDRAVGRQNLTLQFAESDRAACNLHATTGAA